MGGGVDIAHNIALLPVLLPIMFVAFWFHELAHVLVATALGDNTPRELGNLTLNPARHVDKFGFLVLIFTTTFLGFPFGWSKTIVSNRRRLKRGKLDAGLIALAGPMMNFLMAFVLYAIVTRTGVPNNAYMSDVLFTAIQINLVLCVINMLPIPPLDGSTVIAMFLPNPILEDWERLAEYGPLIFLAAILLFQNQFSSMVGSMTIWLFRFMDTLNFHHSGVF